MPEKYEKTHAQIIRMIGDLMFGTQLPEGAEWRVCAAFYKSEWRAMIIAAIESDIHTEPISGRAE